MVLCGSPAVSAASPASSIQHTFRIPPCATSFYGSWLDVTCAALAGMLVMWDAVLRRAARSTRILHGHAQQRGASNLRVTVNGRPCQVPEGSTLLHAVKAAGCHVPTLCYHPRFKPKAVCRMCLVDVEGSAKPLPACATPAADGLVINTDSDELRAFRRTDGELLLARHPNACMSCEVSGSCKLQSLVLEEELHDRFPKVPRGKHMHGDPAARSWMSARTPSGENNDGGAKHTSPFEFSHELRDHSSPAIARDMDKCIECGLCVAACGPEGQDLNIIGFVERASAQLPLTVFDKPLSETACISCGQCTYVCPVGALSEQPAWHRVLDVLDSRRRTTVVQVAPATRVAIGEEFGIAPGTVSTGKLCNALRALGFDFVFDTNFTADLTIMEEGSELLHRVTLAKAAADEARRGSSTDARAAAATSPLPMFTSCCPGWVNFVETAKPELLPHLSTTKSPQQMHGALTKRGPFAATASAHAPQEASHSSGDDGPFVVSVMPCTAKKDEARRPGMCGDVDEVITTRELARMIKARNIPFAALSDDPLDGQHHFDNPLGESTGAAVIFGASGGVMEAALRTAVHLAGLNEEGKPASIDFHALRGVGSGRPGASTAGASVKVAEVPGLGKVAAINGISQAKHLLADPTWKDQFIMIEVMACVGGCLGGGGEPKSDDPEILVKRAAGVYSIDERAVKRCSHDNSEVQKLYRDFLGAPLSHTSHNLLHTVYSPRWSERHTLSRFLDAIDRRDGDAAAALFEEDGEWDTGTAVFGKIKGRSAVAEFVSSRLPPNGKGPDFARHRLLDATSGLCVVTPSGDRCEFTVEVGPGGRRMQSLVRHAQKQ